MAAAKLDARRDDAGDVPNWVANVDTIQKRVVVVLRCRKRVARSRADTAVVDATGV